MFMYFLLTYLLLLDWKCIIVNDMSGKMYKMDSNRSVKKYKICQQINKTYFRERNFTRVDSQCNTLIF